MPKLLQINSVVNTGSTGRIAEQLGRMVLEHGWESYIAYGRSARTSNSHLIRIGGKLSVYVHAVISMLTDRHGLFSRFATKRFLRQIDKIKPDVVHLHNIHGYYINVPMLLAYLKNRKIPTVVTMHDFWLMTGHCAYINSCCDKWKTGCGNCPRLSQYPSAKTDHSARNWEWKKNAFEGMDNITLVPVSHWLDGFVKQSLLKDLRAQVIYNGIDTKVFKPFEGESVVKGIDWEKFTIMCIATRWTDANGFDDVMKLSHVIPVDVQIVMVGLNDNQLSGLPSNIIGMKVTESFSQLQELYTKSDVIFNPNKEVTFGLVTAEAMACGTPAIVLRNTAGEELVNDETGFVVDSVDEVCSLIPIIKDADNDAVAAACRDRVIGLFNADRQYHKYIDLYNGLIGKSNEKV